MKGFFSVSSSTLSSIAIVCALTLFSSFSRAESPGGSEAEIERLEGEVARARNDLNAELLKPGAKSTDPKVIEKTKRVDENLKALQDHFRKSVTRPKRVSAPAEKHVVDADYDNDRSTDSTPDPAAHQNRSTGKTVAPAESAPLKSGNPREPEPSYTLSGEGVKGEIAYPKKGARKGTPSGKAAPAPIPADEPLAESSPTPADAGSGISEIQYQKKPTKKK
jgi:hypothetical protein